MRCSPPRSAPETKSSQKGAGRSRLKSSHFIDYDTDDDGLIEISSLAQLDAVRHDLDGDGTPSTDGETAYAEAFPDAASGMGCPPPTGVRATNWRPTWISTPTGVDGPTRATPTGTTVRAGCPSAVRGSTSGSNRRVVTSRNPFHATFEG